MVSDVEAFAEHVVATIKSALTPVVARIAALENRAPVHGRDGLPGRDGRDVDQALIGELKAEIATLRAELVAMKMSSVSGAAVMSVDPDVVDSSIAKYVAQAIATLPAAKDGADGKDGSSVTVAELEPIVLSAVEKVVAGIPVPKDGKDGVSVDPAELKALVAEHVAEAVSALPVPKNGEPGMDGTSVAIAELMDTIASEVVKAVADLPPAKDGKDGVSVDPVLVEAAVRAEVGKAVAALPAPQDGRSVTVDDVAPLIHAEVQRAVGAVPTPKDGVGVVGALIDRSGHLIVTLSDGATKDVGLVVGKDVDSADVVRLIAEEVAKFPRPKDGADGTDGLGFDDMDFVYDECGRLSLTFQRGDVVKSGRVPGHVDRGVYKAGETYEQGDGVTFGGSYWIAQEPTKAKPGGPEAESRAWRLAVKAGREGKQGEKGLNGTDGIPGRPGKDLTQLGTDGSKW